MRQEELLFRGSSETNWPYFVLQLSHQQQQLFPSTCTTHVLLSFCNPHSLPPPPPSPDSVSVPTPSPWPRPPPHGHQYTHLTQNLLYNKEWDSSCELLSTIWKVEKESSCLGPEWLSVRPCTGCSLSGPSGCPGTAAHCPASQQQITSHALAQEKITTWSTVSAELWLSYPWKVKTPQVRDHLYSQLPNDPKGSFKVEG